MKFKKSILSLTTLAAIAAPIATVVACGDDETTAVAMNFDFKGAKATLVTDAGKITDKSFNQSAWEATNEFATAKHLPAAANIEPKNATGIKNAYKTALNGGSRVLVLPGFTHMSHASGDPEVNQLFAQKQAIGVVVDGWVPGGAHANSHLAPIAYRVEQAAFEAGYASAKYLDAKGDTDPRVGLWTGANASGVSNFAIGYLLGVAYFNQTANPTHPVKFAGNNITLNTGFGNGGGSTVAQNLVDANHADIIMAVAGPQTADALATARGKNVKVIGVDVDQANAYSSDAGLFFTSIQKNIKATVKESLEKIYSGHGAEVMGKLKVATLDHDGVKISDTHIIGDADATAAITAGKDAAIVAKAKTLNLGGDYAKNIDAFLKGTFSTTTGYWGTNGINIAGVLPSSIAALGITTVTGSGN